MKQGVTTAAVSKFFHLLILSLAIIIVNSSVFAQKQQAKESESDRRLTLAISEGGSGNLTATDILFRYEDFKPIVEKALGAPVTLIAVRDIQVLRRSVAAGTFSLVMSRPADVLAEAVRDYGYQAVVVAKEPAHALFIVNKTSPLKTLADIKGKSIVVPDRNAYMWRIAKAMMRDNKISMANENVRSMNDQAAIGWSMEGGFFDVGVVASFSSVGRTWEKNGGRVLARSPEVPNTPLIASQKLSASQIQRLRTALVSLDSTQNGPAVLKNIGLTGFKEVSTQTLVDLTAWLGDMEMSKAGVAQR